MCFAEMSKVAIQAKCNECWRELKSRYKGEELHRVTQGKIAELNERAAISSARRLEFFARVSRYVVLYF